MNSEPNPEHIRIVHVAEFVVDMQDELCHAVTREQLKVVFRKWSLTIPQPDQHTKTGGPHG
jgi:hypothetical protein